MNIGIVTPYVNNYGGGEIFIDKFVKYGNMKDRNNTFYIFTADSSAFSQETIIIPEISNYILFFKNYRKLISELKKKNIDIVILNDYFLGQFSVLFQKKFSIIISLIHGEIDYIKINNKTLKGIIIKLRLWLILLGSKKILSVNKTNLKLYKDNKKVAYIGNFIIPCNSLKENTIKKFDFIYSGRLVKLKNIEYMLDAFQYYVINLNQKAKLLIIGEGEEKRTVLEYVNKNNLENNVILLGHIRHDDIYEFYEQSKTLLLFSITEGFPTVVLEALQSGIPCVVSNESNNCEIISDDINGYSFSLKDDSIEIIARKMEKAQYLDTDTCKESAKQYYVEKFYYNFMKQIIA